MFIAALYTIARTWKQPKCPSTDDWIRKMTGLGRCIHNGILLSHKKERNNAFEATWIKLETLILSEVIKRKTDTI